MRAQRCRRPPRTAAPGRTCTAPGGPRAFGYMDFSHPGSEGVSERAVAMITAYRRKVPRSSTPMHVERTHVLRMQRLCELSGLPPERSRLVELFDSRVIPQSYLPLVTKDPPVDHAYPALREAVRVQQAPPPLHYGDIAKEAAVAGAGSPPPSPSGSSTYCPMSIEERQEVLAMPPDELFGGNLSAALLEAEAELSPRGAGAALQRSCFMTQQAPKGSPSAADRMRMLRMLKTLGARASPPLPPRKLRVIAYPAHFKRHGERAGVGAEKDSGGAAAAPAPAAAPGAPRRSVPDATPRLPAKPFCVGDMVRFRDSPDEEWREGCVVSIDNHGCPLIPVMPQGSPYSWQEVEHLPTEEDRKKIRGVSLAPRALLPRKVRDAVRRARARRNSAAAAQTSPGSGLADSLGSPSPGLFPMLKNAAALIKKAGESSPQTGPQPPPVPSPIQQPSVPPQRARTAPAAAAPTSPLRRWQPEAASVSLSAQVLDHLEKLSSPPKWWAETRSPRAPQQREPFLAKVRRERAAEKAARAAERKLCRKVPIKVFLHSEQFS